MKLPRRHFIQLLLINCGSRGLLGTWGRTYALAQAQENGGEPAPNCQFFNVKQARTLEALCDQIIPPDDYPGAKSASVLSSIDKALVNWSPRNRWDYVMGLEGLDESSRLMFGRPFAELEPREQTKVVLSLESGDAPGKIWEKFRLRPEPEARGGREAEKSSQAFLNLVIGHTMQGYYGDSQYGGNRDRVSWKMIGYLGMR